MKNLFEQLLSDFDKNGLLSHLILIGSWCLIFYREYFKDAAEIPVLSTMDIDFLVPQPLRLQGEVDVKSILTKHGFDEEFSVLGGFSKFVHPELEVEFLIAEKGRGHSTAYPIKALNITAQGLRYMSFIQDNATLMSYKGLKAKVPKPGVFVLLKYLISKKRKDEAKRLKDLATATELGEFLLTDEKERAELKASFVSSMPGNWQKRNIKNYPCFL
jgi:hypothetical protein